MTVLLDVDLLFVVTINKLKTPMILLLVPRTPSLSTSKLLLTLAMAYQWSITTLDISTAFLHALVTGDDIFVIPPVESYPQGGILWKLRRAGYGLRNAPRLWQDHFASVMKSNNFERMKSGPNFYVHRERQL